MIRRSGWAAACLALVAVLVQSGCSSKPDEPLLFTVSGHARMTGFLLDANSVFLGTKVVGDPDGAVVELVYGERVLQRATTVKGVYTFHGVSPGGYVVRGPIVGTVEDATRTITVAGTDLAVTDTLRLDSHGDLYPVPNPSVDTCRVFYEVPVDEHVTIRVTHLDGRVVQTLTDHPVLAGLRLAVWDGLDEHGVPATEPYYWVTFESGNDYRAQLLFR